MPQEGPGRRFDTAATKATTHGAPIVEHNFAGIAAKSGQPLPMAPSVANAAIAQQIAVGDDVVIMLDGVHEVAVSLLPAGAVVGTQLWIVAADNTLANAAAAGRVKFAVVQEIDTNLGRSLVNLTQRSSF